MSTYQIERFSIGVGNSADATHIRTKDGKRALDLWNDTIVPSLNEYNAAVDPLEQLFGYRSEMDFEEVVQGAADDWQEEALEDVNPTGTVTKLFRFPIRVPITRYTKSASWTRGFLESNTAATIVDTVGAVVKRLRTQRHLAFMRALYLNTPQVKINPLTQETQSTWPLVNGTGNMPIPDNGLLTWPLNGSGVQTHTHFIAINSASGQPWAAAETRVGPLKTLISLVTEHGLLNNIVVFGRGQVIEDIRRCPEFRQYLDLPSGWNASTVEAITTQDPQIAIKAFQGMGGNNTVRMVGTIENAVVLESEAFPDGYVGAFSWGGPNSASNPVRYSFSGIRPETNSFVPYLDLTWKTAFGATIQKRLNGAIARVASGATSYTPPSVFATPGQLTRAEFTGELTLPPLPTA